MGSDPVDPQQNPKSVHLKNTTISTYIRYVIDRHQALPLEFVKKLPNRYYRPKIDTVSYNTSAVIPININCTNKFKK